MSRQLLYLRAAKNAGISDNVRTKIVNFLASNPMAGDELIGTGGCRKLRFADEGRGKSGSFRIVHFYSGENVPVFLLAAFAKKDIPNLSNSQKADLKKLTDTLASNYARKIVDLEKKR